MTHFAKISKTGKLLEEAGFVIVVGSGFEYAYKTYNGRNFGLSYPIRDAKTIGYAKMAACVAEKFRGFTPDPKPEPQSDPGDESEE